jgi:DNA-binding transcriptional ArsR family regulator
MPERDVFCAISDPTRREILCMLADNPLPVGAMTRHFRISRPAVSKHLRVLREMGLVREERKGRERIYSINSRPLQEVRMWIAQFDRLWAVKLKNVKTTRPLRGVASVAPPK